MDEAQELSDRVGIMDHGEIIALDTQQELTQQVGEDDRLEFHLGPQPMSEALLARLESDIATVTRVIYTPPQVASGDAETGDAETGDAETSAQLTVFAVKGRAALPGVIQALSEAGVAIHQVQVLEPDLEAVFLALTGRALRD